MKSVFMVTASVGWYEDKQDWNVVAYTDESKAQEHARLLNEFSRAQQVKHAENRKENEARLANGRPYQRVEFKRETTKLDPDFYMDGWDAPEYEVTPVPLLRSVPRV